LYRPVSIFGPHRPTSGGVTPRSCSSVTITTR
jgi:hypothetical protein